MSALSPEHILHKVKLKAQTKMLNYVNERGQNHCHPLSTQKAAVVQQPRKNVCYAVGTKYWNKIWHKLESKFQTKQCLHYMSIQKSQPRIAVQFPKELRVESHVTDQGVAGEKELKCTVMEWVGHIYMENAAKCITEQKSTTFCPKY